MHYFPPPPTGISVPSPPPSPPQNDPAPKWGRTLYEVLHGVHTIKFCFDHCNDEITGFSLRNLVAGESCNFIGEYCERGSTSEYKILIGYRTLAGEFCVVNREFSDLRSPIPNEHPE